MGFRRFNRQIEVFDISLMAVVTKAMGAFLVIMLLLMPYYQSSPAFEKSAQELQQQIDDLEARLAEMDKNVGRFKDDPDELKRQLAALIAQVNDAKARIVALQRQLDQSWSQARRMEAQVAALERENAVLARQKQALDRELAAWRDIDKHKTIAPRFSLLVHSKTAPACLERKGPARAAADESNVINFSVLRDNEYSSLAPTEETERSLFRLLLGSSDSRRLVGLANQGYVQTSAGHAGKNPFANALDRNESFTLFNVAGTRAFLAAQRRSARPDDIDCPVEIRLMVFAGALSQWIRLPDLLQTDLPALASDVPAAQAGPSTVSGGATAAIAAKPFLLAFVDTAVRPGSNLAPLRLPTVQDVRDLKQSTGNDVVIRSGGSE